VPHNGEKVRYTFSSRTMRQNADMGRVRRVDSGSMIYHALNRATFGSWVFERARNCRASGWS